MLSASGTRLAPTGAKRRPPWIPIPGTRGYIHPGDAFVILSGVCLGSVYGAFAAGGGSTLFNLIGGYLVYVPITLVIKGLVIAVILYPMLSAIPDFRMEPQRR